jgi:hypothetical protein
MIGSFVVRFLPGFVCLEWPKLLHAHVPDSGGASFKLNYVTGWADTLYAPRGLSIHKKNNVRVQSVASETDD